MKPMETETIRERLDAYRTIGDLSVCGTVE